MALTTDETEELKYWLNYGNLTTVAVPYFDIALVFEDVVAPNLSSWAETQVRAIFVTLRTIEPKVTEQLDRRQAKSVDAGDIVLNERELDDILRAMDYWVRKLEQVTMVARRRGAGGGGNAVTVY